MFYDQESKFTIGDLIRLPVGFCSFYDISDVAVIVGKKERSDQIEFDWEVLVDGQRLLLGRQAESDMYLLV